MKVSDLRNKMGEQLLERRKESFDKNKGGLRFGSIIDPDANVQEWYCKEGQHLIDIIPYIAGEGNPERRIKPGNYSDQVTFYVHKNVGANDAQYICPSYNYNKPCPICEYAKELRERGDDGHKALRPKRVTLYNVIVYDDKKEEEKGVQVWAVAHWNMERHLNVLSQKQRGGGKVVFSHPDVGKSIAFERQGSGPDNTQYLGHKFEDRDYVIPDEILNSTYCLEEIVNKADYDEIAEAFFGSKYQKTAETSDTPEPDEAPSLRTARKPMAAKQEEPQNDVVSACYGISIDELEICGDCKVYNECMRQYELNEKESEPEPETEPEPTPAPAKTTKPSLRGGLRNK